MVLIFSFGNIIDLYFVAIMHRHPFLTGLDRNADEHTGIVIMVTHFEDDPNGAIAELAARPVEQPHAAVGLNESVFDRHGTGPHMLPSGEVFAVEKLLPFISLRMEERGRQ